MEHPVPRQTASWAYVFGSAALTVFMLQLVTGILLALLYVPSAGEAWNSLQILNHQVTLWLVHSRALHGWGSNFMVAIVLIHMVQVFLSALTNFPRTDLDGRYSSAAADARDGLHRPGASIRSGRLLGIGHRRVHFKPHTRSGAVDREASAGRPDHRRRDALAVLRAARVRDPGIADCVSSACICCWC
jgi:hypothetical protein